MVSFPCLLNTQRVMVMVKGLLGMVSRPIHIQPNLFLPTRPHRHIAFRTRNNRCLAGTGRAKLLRQVYADGQDVAVERPFDIFHERPPLRPCPLLQYRENRRYRQAVGLGQETAGQEYKAHPPMHYFHERLQRITCWLSHDLHHD